MKKDFDADTTKQLGRAASIEAMLGSTGWSFAEADLKEYIAKLKDISTIDLTAENVTQQIRDQVNTAAVLEDWLESLKSQVNNAIIITRDEQTTNTVERR